MDILHLSHNEIDRQKYDSAITKCNWGRIYAMSWFLDIVSPDWEILASEDYSIVMPLPVKKKYGFKYLTQPKFCQQLGVFATSNITVDVLNNFYNRIPFRLSRFQGNTRDSQIYSKEVLRPNYFLTAQKGQDSRLSFTTNTKRNLKKAIASGNAIVEISTTDYIRFIREHNPDVYGESFVPQLERLATLLCAKGIGNIYATTVNNQTTAAVFIATYSDRIYYLSPVSSANGKEMQSMTYIVNHLIEKAQQEDKILDFEGSAIESVARFYAGFGAEKELYGVWRKLKLFC